LAWEGEDVAPRDDAFAGLLASPGVEEVVELRSPFGFMAFHGGGLEHVTDVIARRAAAAAGASCYLVLHPDDGSHLPSIAVHPGASPALASFLAHVEVVVTVHGYGRDGMWTSLLAGGSNRDLARHLAAVVGAALPGYEVVHDVDAIPEGLRGLHPRNPVNLPRHGGVQLELPPRVRGTSPLSPPPGPDGLSPPTAALIDALATVAREWTPSPPRPPGP
jgi:phage replication-related protein YjqB (UPF0714/DUF867 family)